jgi:hypothetical protein
MLFVVQYILTGGYLVVSCVIIIISTRHMKNGQQSLSCLDVTQLYHHIPVYVFHMSSVTGI